ncbi:MAG: PDZ domain-containing protein [Candidatus Omnitrophica bacterium]|nr:PDZ domain-containing protein [Candidatus Omnitrophota bacterium]
MTKSREILITTLVSSVMAIQGWAFLSKPKVAVNKEYTKSLTQDAGFRTQDIGRKTQAIESLPAPNSELKTEDKTLQLELLGTAIGNTKDPIAFIKDLESNKQGIYRLGSRVQEAEVIKIALGEVVLERNGKKETLKMSKRAKAWAKLDDSVIISKSNDMITVSRNGLLKEAGRILNTLPTLKFKPYIEGKKATGLMVEGVTEGSIVKEASIQNKDVIKTVNGQTVNSYQQALQVASKMRNQSEIKVSILRDGKLQNLSFQIVR